MEKLLSMPIKEVLTQYPNVGKILQDYGVGCVSCGVGTCLLKYVVHIHSLSKDEDAELMYRIEKEVYPDRDIVPPAAPAAKKGAPQSRKSSRPIKCLVDEHVTIMKLVNLIPVLAETTDISTAAGKQLIMDAVEFIRSFADTFHHMKEEDILFHYCDHQSDIIQAMLKDHDTARGYIRAAVHALEINDKDGVSSNLVAYAKLLTEHIKKEDEILYPWIDRQLTPLQTAEMFLKFNEVEGKSDAAVAKCVAFADTAGEKIIAQKAVDGESHKG